MTVEELNVKVTADISDLKRDLARMEGAVKGSAKKSEGAMGGAMKKIGGAIAVAFSAQALISFSKKVIEVRSEFEKFEAVLTNTLGSSGAAKLALLDIKEMAARTPFSVAELSGAFVKLTNYGLKPSMEAMRQYGDLASSVGQGFDQLAEAVADATTGEFERLKAFGIKASKQGDKVTFTFKEQATTVDFTTKAIEEYVKGLGDLEGVSGSMAAISETLGGSVSNLGDKFDSLLNTIGESSVWKSVLTSLGDIVETTEVLISTWDQLPVDELKFWTDTEYSIKQLEKAQKDYNEQLRITAANTATYEAAVKAGATPMGQIPTAEKPFVPISSGFHLMTLDPKTGMPLTVEPLKKVGKSADELAKELAKATEEASKLRRARMEGVQLQRSMQQATQLGQRQMGTFNLRLRGQMETGGFVKPTITGPEIKYEDTSNLVLSQLQERTFEADEAMFDFGSSASILSQSLLASAQDTQAAGDIFASAIGAIVSELLTQALATKMGSFAGPLGGLVGGFLTLGLKGADMETSRVRTQNSTARFN